MSKETLIETINLSKSFGKRKVVNNLNLNIQTGDIYGFLGPNGSGKTTTIRMLLGLIFPNEGRVILNGYDIREDFNKAIVQVGALVENPSFYSYLSGRENLQLMANLYPGLSKTRVDEVLEIVRLQDRAKDKVKTYSLGMKQRISIAMALLNNPKLVILDEPTNGLDPQGMKEVKELIALLANEQGISFFISSHLLNEVEQICSKVGIIKEGNLLAQGDVKVLLTTKYETVEVTTQDKDKAISSLKEVEYVKSVQLCQNGVLVEMDKGNTSKLNQHLISQGIAVELLVPQSNSLEKFFFGLTEGGEIR